MTKEEMLNLVVGDEVSCNYYAPYRFTVVNKIVTKNMIIFEMNKPNLNLSDRTLMDYYSVVTK